MRKRFVSIFGLYMILAIPIPILHLEYQNRGGSKGHHILPNIDCKIQRGALQEVSSAKKKYWDNPSP